MALRPTLEFNNPPPPPPKRSLYYIMHGSVGVHEIHFSSHDKQTSFELAQGKIAWAPPGIFSGLTRNPGYCMSLVQPRPKCWSNNRPSDCTAWMQHVAFVWTLWLCCGVYNAGWCWIGFGVVSNLHLTLCNMMQHLTITCEHWTRSPNIKEVRIWLNTHLIG